MKIYIETLGCPKNFNDSEGIAGICEAAGHETVDDPENADVLLVNTCGFINDAKTESIDCIFDMVRVKEQSPDTVLAVTGCLTQRYGKELEEEIPEIDVILGVNDYEKLPEMLSEAVKGKKQFAVNGAPLCFEEFSARKFPSNPYTATLRIAEGCSNRCAYCVIPQIRGPYRSRPLENILEEARRLADAGCREVMLVAQDVTEYGRDIYGRHELPLLLTELCRIEGIRWIRLMYCYEDKITDDLIDVMAREEKICNYIDIPLQHVSDKVLKAMNRRSTGESIRNTISRLRAAMPDIHIRTTFITGFPGESEEDFEELADFAGEIGFERLGVFPYSREENTAADEMENQIDEEVRKARAESIMLAQIEISRACNERKKGKLLEVIVDGQDEDGVYIGRSRYDAPEIDNEVVFKALRKLVPGDIVRVRITDAFDYDLVGVMEEENESA